MMRQGPEPRESREQAWKPIKAAIRLAVAAGILVFLFKKVGGEAIWAAFKQFHWQVPAAAVLGYCVMQAIKTYRFQILLRAIDVRVSYLRLLGMYFIGMFFNTVLPTIVGGDAVRIAYLARDTGKLDRAVASVITERAIGVGALILIAIVALFVSGQDATPVMVYFILAATGVFLVGVLFLFSPWVYRVSTKCMRAIGLGRVEKTISAIQNAFGTYRRQYGILTITMLLSIVVQVVMIALYMLLAYGMGLRLPIGFLFVAVSITVLVSMVPVTVSGLGIREGMWVLFFAQRGLPKPEAMALSLAWFLTGAVAGMFGCPVFLFWRAADQPRTCPTAPAPDPSKDALDHV
ncbi:MAG: lysylphosphatidylglycerol synthase transmembrane domain-containing protein [Planctomycetota bacterium]